MGHIDDQHFHLLDNIISSKMDAGIMKGIGCVPPISWRDMKAWWEGTFIVTLRQRGKIDSTLPLSVTTAKVYVWAVLETTDLCVRESHCPFRYGYGT